MEKKIKELFNENVLKEAAEKFGTSIENIKEVGGFENFIYEYKKDDKDYILRIGHSKSLEMIKSELEFVNYLSMNDSRVCTPIKSINNNLVEGISCEDGSCFIATSFTKANGRHMKREDFTNDFFEEYGRTVGEFHRLSKTFKPTIKRFEWNEDSLFVNAESYLPQSEKHIFEKFKSVMDEINKLPKDINSYGLIHTDIHAGNFFMDEKGKLTVFDFDDCSYKWFISDIAITIFYLVELVADDVKKTEITKNFMIHFMKGYEKENKLDKYWLEQLPKFLKLREILIYIVQYRSLDLNNLPEWAKKFFTIYKPRIENDIPFVDLDFTNL